MFNGRGALYYDKQHNVKKCYLKMLSEISVIRNRRGRIMCMNRHLLLRIGLDVVRGRVTVDYGIM